MGYLPSARREVFFSEPSRENQLTKALDQMLGELGGVFSRLAPELAGTFLQEVETAPRIFGCAVGRSGFILRGFLMRLMHLGFSVHVVGETITPRLQPQDLLIVISGSGETAQPREVLRQANAVGARTLAITAGKSGWAKLEITEVTLAAGASKTFSLTVEVPSATPAADYRFTIEATSQGDDTKSDELQVTVTVQSEGDDDDDSPGFGAVVVMMAVLPAAYVLHAVRRKRL